jgi:hypothetical protein
MSRQVYTCASLFGSVELFGKEDALPRSGRSASAQPRLIVMRAPVRAELPLWLGLPGREAVVDFDLVKA